jgi:uncharacterized protein (DUF3820 family)
MTSADTVMPFGVHKGEPLWDLERRYLEWLLEQEFVEEKFPDLYEDIKDHLIRRDRSGDKY